MLKPVAEIIRQFPFSWKNFLQKWPTDLCDHLDSFESNMIQSVNIEIIVLLVCEIIDALHPLLIHLQWALQLRATNGKGTIFLLLSYLYASWR